MEKDRSAALNDCLKQVRRFFGSPLLHARNDADHDAHGRADYCVGRSLNVLPILFGPRGGFHSEFRQFANLSDNRSRHFFGVAAAEPVFSRTVDDGIEIELVP